MSNRAREHANRRHTSRPQTEDSNSTCSAREDEKDRNRRTSNPLRGSASDRYGSSGGRDYKQQALSQHTLSDSRRSDEAPKAAYAQRTSRSRLYGASETRIEQTAWQGRIQPTPGLPHNNQHKTERRHTDHNTDVRHRDRSTHRHRLPGRIEAHHSQHYALPMQEGNAPAAYQQAWPSRDQQRPPGPNPFRGGGKWKHDLFEELTKPAATAEQIGATKTAVNSDSIAHAAAAIK